SAQDVLNQLAEPTGAELVADGSQTVSQSLSVKFNGLSFAAGGVANSAKDLFYYAADKYWYYWNGSFPKTVESGTSPSSTGGVGSSSWLPMSDAVLKALLLSSSGSANVNRPSETVEAALTRTDTRFTNVISLSNRTSIPELGYTGNKHWCPIENDGIQLGNYVFETPTHVDLKFVSDPITPSSGIIFSFGRPDLSGGAAFWSQDSYELKNGTFEGGTPQIAVFMPWTSHTATVENNRILNNGSPSYYALNFRAQNWWPIVRGNTFADYLDKGGNFCKATDDEGVTADKYTGNSRLTFSQNRCKWLGAGIGGVMLYTSGVAATITDNASENSKIAVKFGYPSSYAIVDKLYNEMMYGTQTVFEIGDDDDSGAPSNNYTGIVIRNVYSNFHSINTNTFIRMANNSVLLNEIDIDGVNITNLPTSGFIQPIVKINDIAFQKIIAGSISAANSPLIPLTTNRVAVVDKYGLNIPAINSDLVYINNATVSVPANSSTVIAPGWFARSNSSATFTRTGSGAAMANLRDSRFIGSLSAAAGAQSSIYFQFTDAILINSEYATIQFLINTSQNVNNTVVTSVFNPDGSRSQIDTRTISSGASWQEVTITISSRDANSSGSMLNVEINNSSSSAMTTYVTGFRLNRGQYGLCYKADIKSYGQTAREQADYTYITP
ncbi:TPA: hypothetical protein SCR94_004967, partial [Enterobacter cloacae]|nr:hypothetical protein [Enterobacter cloacae]